MAHYVIGVTGASGIILAYKLLDSLTQLGHSISLVMTKDASATAILELGAHLATAEKMMSSLSEPQQQLIKCYAHSNFYAPIASGSCRFDGMVIVPCSMATLAAVAMGLADNLVRRAADVTLKERRKLVIVPRESPFSSIHLENLLKLSQVGAVIVPPIPAWYSLPKSLEEVEQFIVGRILDVLAVEGYHYPRWGEEESKL